MSEDRSATETGSDGLSAAEQRKAVRARYADIATDSATCCGDTGESPCGSDTDDAETYDDRSRSMGYAEDALESVASGANLGLGCGNPTAIASLELGETVLDLGSGAGFDCFLAGQEVGPEGRVVGVDMTPEMVEKARENARENDATNVEFRLGEIEHLPVADGSIDVIISNCVVNLSPDKPQVFADAFRALRPGGRLAISDVVTTAPLSDQVRADPSSVAACVAGASSISALESMLIEAGFENISIEPKADSESFIREWDDERDLSEYVVSATIEARKPVR
ncbi:arsenite methyltransferase [Natronosalvus caseinilyticus]|uniref:arsenite methyltransferase n=1 Tax=Natronosalvus caseinilyticus TaxID=2953747 RepID=UPI0028ADFC37|nr:arsenite methyltransferase [Natronosalvus caseinilyticus]